MSERYRRAEGFLLLFLSLGAARCGSSGPGLSTGVSPIVEAVTLTPNPNNVLSAVMTATVRDADKVRISYQAQGSTATSSTPDVAISGPETITLPVFGLRPETSYSMWVTALTTGGRTTDSPQLSLRTGSLPSYFPVFSVERPGNPQPGYTMVAWTGTNIGGTTPDLFNDQNAALIVDQDGQVAWYKEFPGHIVLDWQRQPDDNYTAAVDQANPWTTESYRQFDKLGNELRTWTIGGDLSIDDHELRVLANGDALLFATNARTMDLSGIGGQPQALVLGNLLIRMNSNNQFVFQWDSFDHLPAIDDLDPQIDPTGDIVDWTHGNAIDVTADGNYLMSFRNISQVVKIDSRSGAVLWKLGGSDGNFTFLDDPLQGFSLQHGIRELANGNLLLFDNGASHDPPQSRAVEYQLDLNARTARMVWQYDANPALFAFAMGFAQRLQNGNTLVTYGILPYVHEVNRAGELQWSLLPPEQPGIIYRSFRIPSLY
jgi:hypothetical protein